MEITAKTPVRDTPSGMGGTFTVVLLEDDPAAPTVLARVCYGRLDGAGRYHPWREWDGYTFRVRPLGHPAKGSLRRALARISPMDAFFALAA